MTKTEKRKFGDIGENLACQFLMKRGFKVIFRNYLKPWGEIDVIATKDRKYHFIEVKSVNWYEGNLNDVIHETRLKDGFRPEENVHPQKLRRLHRAIQTYLMENNIESDWQIDVITVKMDESKHKAQIEIIENIVG